MVADNTRNRIAGKATPAEAGYNLTAAMMADDADLPIYGKALRIRNGSTADVKIVVTPLHAATDTATIGFTIGAGEREILPVSVRRIWSTGSTGLAAALTAGTAEVQIFTE